MSKFLDNVIEQAKADAAGIVEAAKKRGEMEHDKIIAEAQKSGEIKYLVKIGDDRYVVLWEMWEMKNMTASYETSYGTYASPSHGYPGKLKAVVVD